MLENPIISEERRVYLRVHLEAYRENYE